MIDNRFDRQIVSGDLFSELLASMRRAAFAGAAKHPSALARCRIDASGEQAPVDDIERCRQADTWTRGSNCAVRSTISLKY